ncbi:putative ABC transport system permease protein [Metabacillus crassostreae]|uniref:ABC transporter permease n=1 Tax=Metabacillus crassostreae TaxID=929098 RepID=UPI00195BBBFD|nr:ABC transporter permease [Metabacillus crassostreae]MBM7603118.1 putative ABC transport system permease protein [Metabacillus crassostreae]
MTFRQFAFNNVTRNKRLYAAYFLSSMFTVMVFFTFAIFAFHPVLSGDEMNGNVTSGMNISAWIIYVFSFFFILYSMSSFLQSRKKEFGLLMLQGMTSKQIRLMVFLENMLIGFFATLGGILLGLVFAKGILLLAENVLIIDERLHFYLPIQAILLSFVSFILLFFCISLFVSYVLRSKKLIDLIKGNKKSKGEPKANLFLTIIAVSLLGIGYAVALMAKGVVVITVMVPVILLVIAGTYLMFTQLSVFVIGRLKKKESFFWYKTNMLLFSDLAFRMKDNARTFFMVSIVSTIAFCAIGTLFGFQAWSTSGTKITNPNSITYRGQNADEDVAFINKTLQKHNIVATEEQMMLSYFDVEGEKIVIAKQSDYNHFAKLIDEEIINLQEGQMITVEFEGFSFGQMNIERNEPVNLNSGDILKSTEVIYSRALPSVDPYYVVSDGDFEQISTEPADEVYFHAWQVTSGKENVIEASEKLQQNLEPYEFTSVDYDVYQLNKSYAPILFVGLFIGIVFFISAGSFLYFRLYMDLDEDKQKFKSISKMGLSEKELKKVLTKQTAILFFAPIIVALIHGAVALTALSNFFSFNLFKESVVVLGVFFIIQVVYFFIVRFFYSKQIIASVQ